MNLKKNVKKLLRWTYEICADGVATIAGLKNAKMCALAPSYYPETEHKPEKTRIRENREWAKKYGEANEFYTLYGLDRVGSKPEEYMDYRHFMKSRNCTNHTNQLDSQVILLRDKYLFFRYMKTCNMPVPDVFALWRNGKLYDIDFNEKTLESIKDKKDYFVKSVDGECASFVRHIKTYSELQDVIDEIKQSESVFGGMFIFQEKVVQSLEMNALNASAINTYRIVTVNKDGNPYVLTSLLRVGTKKTGNVDNWAAGGLAIGINANGFLKQYGFYKPIHGIKAEVHPDTDIRFSEFMVPAYKEAMEIAQKAHKLFYGVRTIGWDIAISENGPVFIEGNDNWEISLHQACDRPLRKEWEEIVS